MRTYWAYAPDLEEGVVPLLFLGENDADGVDTVPVHIIPAATIKGLVEAVEAAEAEHNEGYGVHHDTLGAIFTALAAWKEGAK